MHSYRARRIGRFGRVGKVYNFASMRARHVRANPSDPSAFPLLQSRSPLPRLCSNYARQEPDMTNRTTEVAGPTAYLGPDQ
jgi:hypothetical protein